MAMVDPVKVEIEILHEWQLCSKCVGTGLIWGANWPYSQMIISTAPVECDLCNGKKIISKVTGNPPE